MTQCAFVRRGRIWEQWSPPEHFRWRLNSACDHGAWQYFQTGFRPKRQKAVSPCKENPGRSQGPSEPRRRHRCRSATMLPARRSPNKIMRRLPRWSCLFAGPHTLGGYSCRRAIQSGYFWPTLGISTAALRRRRVFSLNASRRGRVRKSIRATGWSRSDREWNAPNAQHITGGI